MKRHEIQASLRERFMTDVVRVLLMDGKSSYGMLCIISCILIACPTCAVRGAEIRQTSESPLPIDVSYRIGSSNYTLYLKTNGTVRLFATGKETEHGKCREETFATITSLLRSEELQKSLVELQKQDISFGPNRRKLIALWGRGTPDGIKGERPYHPTVMIALDDITQVPEEIVDLLRLLDQVGADTFGGSYELFLAISPTPGACQRF